MYYAINHMKSQATTHSPHTNNILLSKANNFVFTQSLPTSTIGQNQSKPLKILLIITQGVWGGAQRYVLDLARELATNHQVTVAVGEVKGAKHLQKKLSLENNIHLVQLKHLQRAISPLHDIMALFELRQLYKKINPDIVHLNSTKASVIGSWAKLLIGKPFPKIVYTVHGWIFLEPLSTITKRLFLFLEKLTATSKDALIVLSTEEKEIGTKILHLAESKMCIIPLGISPVVALSQSEAKEKIESITQQTYQEKKWIGTIAGLYKTKGLETLLLTVAANTELQKHHYFIIGEGPERSHLKWLIEKNNLTKTVTLTGHIDNAARLLPAFDLFVLPSQKEGLPYVLLEAMSLNVPLIATRVGGIPSLLKTYPQAEIISPNNIPELRDAILHLAEKNSSLPFSFNQTHTLDAMITSTLQLYYSLLEEPGE